MRRELQSSVSRPRGSEGGCGNNIVVLRDTCMHACIHTHSITRILQVMSYSSAGPGEDRNLPSETIKHLLYGL